MDGFAIVPRSVIEIMPRIGGNGLAVYVSLVDHANADFKCWPSKKRISKLTGVSLRAVRIQLIALEAIGVIAIESRMDGLRHETNLYKILPPYRPPKRVVQNLHEVAHEMHECGAENDPRVAQEMHPNKSKRTRVKEQRGANASVLNFDEVSFPEGYDTPEVRKAISDWYEVRTGRKHKKPNAAISKMLARWPKSDLSVRDFIDTAELAEIGQWQTIDPSYCKSSKPKNEPRKEVPIDDPLR